MKMKILKDPVAIILLLIATLSLPSAIWMLTVSLHWYESFPAKVPDFGDFNPHFVRDLGCAYLTISIALFWAALRPTIRFPLTVIATLFYCGHALVHVFDTLRGHVDDAHWWIDFPSTYLPALLLIGVLYKDRSQ